MKIALIMGNKKKQGFPPLGVLYLAGYLRKYKPTCNIDVFDVFPSANFPCNEYDVIGLSCMSIQYPDVCDYAKALRNKFKGKIVFGGVHITLTKMIPDYVDFGIVGEGEETLYELVSFLDGDDSFHSITDINGLIINDGYSFIMTPKRAPIADLDKIPFPAWDLVDMNYYLKPNNVYGTVVGRGLSLMTSRGCCFNCQFCSSVKMWETLRFHSAEYVVDMIEYVVATYQIQYIWYADDHFTLNRRRLKRIADLIEERNIHVGMGISCRVDSYDDELCQILKRIGVSAIALGLETGSDRILSTIKSGIKMTVAEEAEIVKKMVSDGFQVHGMFILNTPTETMDDLKKTVDFIYSLPLCKVSVAIATPYYGTVWWDIAKQQGIVSDNPNDFALLRAYNMKTIENTRVLFKTEIKRSVLERVYTELANYSKSLFFFDWENR